MSVVAVVLIWNFAFKDGGERRQTSPGRSETTGTPLTQASEPSYALQTNRNTWPPAIEDASEPSTRPEGLLATNYYVVLDGSGSMAETGCSGGTNKMQAAMQALATFARSVPAEANFALAVFNRGGVDELIPLGRGNQERIEALQQRIEPGGSTPLRSSIAMAYERLSEQGSRQLGYGEYHLVVITDGKASGGEDPTPVVRTILSESPVTLHTIGFCIGTDHALNQPGRSFYRAADNPEDLRRGLEEVLAEAPAFDITRFGQ